MIHFTFADSDNRYLFLKCDNTPDELVELIDNKTKKKYSIHIFDLLKRRMNLVDPISYLPRNNGKPDIIQEFIWEYVQPSGRKIMYASIGLWQDVYKILKENNVPYDGLEPKWFKHIKMKHTFEEFKEIVDGWHMSITPRPYQYESAYKILQWNRSLSQLATRAGKTLISYMIFRYDFTLYNRL